jgi:hypothetical protein
MDCYCDCTTDLTGTDVVPYPEATDVTFPEPTDVVVEFPALNEGTTVALPPLDPAEWGLGTTPATTTPAPSLVDPFIQQQNNQLLSQIMDSQAAITTNIIGPYGPDYTYHAETSSDPGGWYRDGDLAPSTPMPTSYDD